MTADLVVAALMIEGLDAEVAWERGELARVDVLWRADGVRSTYVAICRGRAYFPPEARSGMPEDLVARIRRAVAAATASAVRAA